MYALHRPSSPCAPCLQAVYTSIMQVFEYNTFAEAMNMLEFPEIVPESTTRKCEYKRDKKRACLQFLVAKLQ